MNIACALQLVVAVAAAGGPPHDLRKQQRLRGLQTNEVRSPPRQQSDAAPVRPRAAPQRHRRGGLQHRLEALLPPQEGGSLRCRMTTMPTQVPLKIAKAAC